MKRKLLSVLFALAGIWFMLPLFGGMLHIGMIYPALIFAFLAVVAFEWHRIKPLFSSKYKHICRILTGLFAVGVLMILVPLGFMASAALNTATDAETVIVLGCKVRGDEPSLMLKNRCDVAIGYLNDHPDAVCVASGGMGGGENISEARAIYNYLTEHGIASERIYIEDKSSNTSENLAFSASIIEKNQLSPYVAIASDNFHQFRGAYFAEKNGLTASALGCPTVFYLTAGYWAREVIGFYKAVILGY